MLPLFDLLGGVPHSREEGVKHRTTDSSIIAPMPTGRWWTAGVKTQCQPLLGLIHILSSSGTQWLSIFRAYAIGKVIHTATQNGEDQPPQNMSVISSISSDLQQVFSNEFIH
ncbi:hypothetical protein LOD99_1189 [Oopsacas minuta]|uniref:Uncharacterized protein n=1 Tax=Oopsacas minuta TaxID=111878 RepID=A0AAV7K6A8_9METZ|nr:hypothetical protein LOD99_1189 [Oopsacas minuta]